MSEENNASGQPGSAQGDQGSGNGKTATATVDLSQYVPKTQYEEAQRKIGEQGSELGEFRTFYKEMTPLLDKLDAQPELVEAIVKGTVDASLAKAVAEGKVTMGEAKAVTKANEEVKKTMGEAAYDKANPADITKLIAEALEPIKASFASEVAKTRDEIKVDKETREIEKTLDSFIENTPDYAEYAEEVLKYIEDHDVRDIEVAYDAVKGKAIAKADAVRSEKERAEEGKRNAAGAGQGGRTSSGRPITAGIENYVRVGRNPNLL